MSSTPSTRIVLSGWHGHDNAGDDATLLAFIDEAVASRGRQLTVLSELPERVIDVFGSKLVTAAPHYETVGLHGLTHLVKGRLGGHLKLLKESDLFVLGGGSLLRDNTTWHNFFRVVDEIFWAHWFGKKVALYAGGIGPIRTRLGGWLIKQAVKRCDLITVRDEGSLALLVQLGIDRARVHVVSDPGFLLKQRPVRDEALLAEARKPGTVGFFPSLGFIEDGDDLSGVPLLAAGLDSLHEQRGLRFLSIPMRVLSNEIDDVHVTNLIRAKMRHPEALLVHTESLGAGELKSLTGAFEFNLTIRLHALIFSLSNAVPTVAIEYEPKVTNLLRDFALSECGAKMGAHLTNNVVQSVLRVYDDQERVVQHTRERLPSVRASSQSFFDHLERVLR